MIIRQHCCVTFFFLFATFVFLAFASKARADTVLFLAPMRVDLSDKNPIQEVRVTNVSSISRSYNLSIENIVMNEDGATSRVDNFDFSAKRLVRFVPRKFDIEPGGQQIVRFMARFPSSQGELEGDYHSHIQFLENVSRRDVLNEPKGGEDNIARMNAEISYATAIPLVVTKGEVKTDIAMRDLFVSLDEKKRPFINLTIDRLGNGQGNTMIEVEHISSDGVEEAAALRRTVYVYRELSFRKHKFLLERLKPGDLKPGDKLRIKLFNRNISETDPVDTVLIPAT